MQRRICAHAVQVAYQIIEWLGDILTLDAVDRGDCFIREFAIQDFHNGCPQDLRLDWFERCCHGSSYGGIIQQVLQVGSKVTFVMLEQ
jgi:hypothetical protein